MKRKFLPLALVLLLSGCATTSKPAVQQQVLPSPMPIANAPQVFNSDQIALFAKQVAQKNGLSEQALLKILNQAELKPNIVNAMNRPFEKLSWARYEKLYVRPSLISGGVKFWSQNQQILLSASKQYGVPSQIIMAILGVETVYGQNIGTYRALDALYTLSFDYPRRAAFFQKELAAYLVLTSQAGFDATTVKSSYAGALGMPQFMPTSYMHYAVSNSAAYPNLFTNVSDIASSVANYLDQMGWQKDKPVAIKADLSKNVKLTEALKNNTYTLQEFKKYGIHAEVKMPGDLKANLVILDGQNGPEYWLTFKNFSVIKKYNSSNLYAMAVYQIAEQLACAIPATPNMGVNCLKKKIKGSGS